MCKYVNSNKTAKPYSNEKKSIMESKSILTNEHERIKVKLFLGK